VKYLECKSPIHVARRPIYLDYVAKVRHGNFETATEQIADYIRDELLPKYKKQKGFIHTTYSQAKLLRKYLRGQEDRLLFHSSETKGEVLREFKESDPREGKVLVASGMYEGVSLDYEIARWQAIAKVPWMSLADAATKHKADNDPEWYVWNTLKDLIQACGRVCRTPSDYGKTHILDGTMDSLLTEAEKYEILPEWFADALAE